MPELAEVTDMVEKLKGALTFISDTFVNASHLSESVKELQGQVDAMRVELDSLHQHNATLAETIAHVQRERDEAQTEAMNLRNEVASAVAQRDQYARNAEEYAKQIEELQQQLTEKRKAHDDAEYRAMHWEEQHRNVKTQLDGIRAALGVAVEPTQLQATGTQGW